MGKEMERRERGREGPVLCDGVTLACWLSRNGGILRLLYFSCIDGVHFRSMGSGFLDLLIR